MKIAIRRANLKSDKGLIIDTLFRFLTPLSDGVRFSWLYENNPHGQPHAWVAYRTDNESTIGVAARFARRIYVNGSEKLSWVLGDFCIDDAYRSLGPALMLQRACLTGIDSGEVAFCYDFPSSSMLAVYKRLQITPFANMIRLAKPLRIDRKVKELIKSPTIGRAVSRSGNLLLRFRERKYRENPGLQVSLYNRACGDEFADLARRIGSRYGVCIQRSAEYLNWRYVHCPVKRYDLFTVRCEGALLGYAVLLQDDDDAMLVDLFGVADESVHSTLLTYAVTKMVARGVQTVSAELIETHPWRELLERQGFKGREMKPIVIYSPSGSVSPPSMLEKQKWLVMQGDRDS